MFITSAKMYEMKESTPEIIASKWMQMQNIWSWRAGGILEFCCALKFKILKGTLLGQSWKN